LNPRSTAILFAVALALGAFVWFYEIEGEEGRRELEAREKRLFPGVDAEAVEWVELRTSDAREVRVARRDGAWEVVEPLAFPADSFAIDAIADALAAVASETVYEDPQEPAVYGLDASSEIRFGVGAASFGLRTGDATPMGSNSYASVVGEEAVYTVPTSRLNALDKSFDDLREKRILDFDAASVQRFTASWPDGRVTLARTEGEWRLELPVAGEADPETIQELLSSLSFLRAASFADEPLPDDLTGLDVPAFAIELELAPAAEGQGEGAGESRRVVLAVGGAEEAEHHYVRAGRPSLFRIPAARLEELPRDVSAYRFRELASFNLLDAQRLDLTFHAESGGSTEALTVTARREGSDWASEPERIDPLKLRRLLEELSRLEASQILAEEVGTGELAALGLDPPRLGIRVFGEAVEEGDAPLLAELRVGELRGGGDIVAQRLDRPEVFSLDAALAEHIPVNIDALRARFLVVEEVADAAPEGSLGGLEIPVGNVEVDPDALEIRSGDFVIPTGEAPEMPRDSPGAP
jgi:hypothetical protein